MLSSKVNNWLRDNIRVDRVSNFDSDNSSESEKSDSSNPKRRKRDYIQENSDPDDRESVSLNPKRKENSVLVVNEPLMESDISLGEYSNSITPDPTTQNLNSCSDYFSEISNKINVKELKFPCRKIDGCRPKINRSSNRPSHTFRCLIQYAIEEAGDGGFVATSQIIDFMCNEFSYFAETPDNIWLPSVKNILKKSFNCLAFDPNTEPCWSVKSRYDPDKQSCESVCSTISSVQSYETTESAKKIILGLDLDISEEEQNGVEDNKEAPNLEKDLDISDSDVSEPVENGLWQVKHTSETKISIAKVSETINSKPKFSMTYIVALVIKDQPLTREEIIGEIHKRFRFYKAQKEDWKQNVYDILMKSDYFLPKKTKGCDAAKWSIGSSDYQRLHEEEFRKLPTKKPKAAAVPKRKRGRTTIRKKAV